MWFFENYERLIFVFFSAVILNKYENKFSTIIYKYRIGIHHIFAHIFNTLFLHILSLYHINCSQFSSFSVSLLFISCLCLVCCRLVLRFIVLPKYLCSSLFILFSYFALFLLSVFVNCDSSLSLSRRVYWRHGSHSAWPSCGCPSPCQLHCFLLQ